MTEPVCHTHPLAAGVAVCPRCGAEMCAECARLSELCPSCRSLTDALNSFVWTKPGQTSTLGILWESWKGIAFHPVKTGRLIGAYPRLSRAWVFAAITVGLTIIANLIFSFFNQIMPALSGESNAVLVAVVGVLTFVGTSLATSLATILFLMLLLSLGQAVLGNRPNFRMTLAVMLYAQVGALLGLLPCVGALLVPLGTIIVAGMLVKGMSGETTGRTTLGVVLPILTLLGGLGIAVYVIWQEIGPVLTEAFRALSLVYYQPS